MSVRGLLAATAGGVILLCLLGTSAIGWRYWFWTSVSAFVLFSILACVVVAYEYAPIRLRRHVDNQIESWLRTRAIRKAQDWRRLSQRGATDVRADALSDGVPGHLRGPLVNWLECQFGTSVIRDKTRDAKALRIATRSRVDLHKHRDQFSSQDVYVDALITCAGKVDQLALLDLVDAALHDRNFDPFPKLSDGPGSPESLDELLREGNSVYRVRRDRTGLERRIDSTVAAVVTQAIGGAAEPGRHLKAAWGAAYALRPNPTMAYAEAVKAVEAAFVPLVLPNDGKATLGKVIGTLRATAHDWELAISDDQGAPARIEPVLSLAGLLWDGHRDRHAGTATAVNVTIDGARMALHAAATLVQWTANGDLRRRGSPPPNRGKRATRGRSGRAR